MSLLGHVAVGVVVARAITDPQAPPDVLPRRMTAFGMLALLPDSDLILSTFVPNVGLFDHRGPSHSLTFAVVVALVAAFALALAGDGHPIRWGLLAGALVASHGLMDSLGQSDLGVQLLWPFNDARLLAPWHILPNPSIDPPLLRNFFREVLVEFVVFLPAWIYAFTPRSWFHWPGRPTGTAG